MTATADGAPPAGTPAASGAPAAAATVARSPWAARLSPARSSIVYIYAAGFVLLAAVVAGFTLFGLESQILR